MAKLWNLSVVATAALLAVSCGSDNDTGGNGSGIGINGAPVSSSGCSTSKSSPGSAGNWDQFKQHVYNCNFDYIIQNVSSYTNNYTNYNNTQNSTYTYGSYNTGSNYNYSGSMMPLMAEYHYNDVRCDQYSGCYPSGGTRRVSVELNQSNGSISSIVDFRSNVNSQSAAHNRLKDLVIGDIKNIEKVNDKAYEFTKGDRRYRVDLTWPMAANPVMDIPVNSNASNQQGYWIAQEILF